MDITASDQLLSVSIRDIAAIPEHLLSAHYSKKIFSRPPPKAL